MSSTPSFRRRLTLAFLLAAIAAPLLPAAETKKTPPPADAGPKPRQFVYVLKLAPRLHDDNAWTEADKQTVATHFAHLKAATATGKVILAGRTLEPGSRTFGLVIFEDVDEEAARNFMNRDPAVAAKVMSATLHPYQIALQRTPKAP
jgi:uncharacterized protein YciI